MATITIARLEQYPVEEPTGHCVGFTVTATNGKSFYTDTVIPFNDADDDDKAVAAAYESLKDSINSRVEALEAKSALLGTEFSPPVVEAEETADDSASDETDAEAPTDGEAPSPATDDTEETADDSASE